MAISVCLAPPEEQNAIVAYADAATLPLRKAIQRTESEIVLLREYRTRLVADIVTGQFDVREAARNLPTEQFETVEVADEAEILEAEDDVPEEDAVA